MDGRGSFDLLESNLGEAWRVSLGQRGTSRRVEGWLGGHVVAVANPAVDRVAPCAGCAVLAGDPNGSYLMHRVAREEDDGVVDWLDNLKCLGDLDGAVVVGDLVEQNQLTAFKAARLVVEVVHIAQTSRPTFAIWIADVGVSVEKVAIVVDRDLTLDGTQCEAVDVHLASSVGEQCCELVFEEAENVVVNAGNTGAAVTLVGSSRSGARLRNLRRREDLVVANDTQKGVVLVVGEKVFDHPEANRLNAHSGTLVRSTRSRICSLARSASERSERMTIAVRARCAAALEARSG